MKNSRKILRTVLILVVGSLLFWYATHPFITVHVKDGNTMEYVRNPNIVFSSEVSNIAGPGTGGGGPLLFSLSVPRQLHVTSKTYGYEEKTVKLFLIPGMSYTIFAR